MLKSTTTASSNTTFKYNFYYPRNSGDTISAGSGWPTYPTHDETHPYPSHYQFYPNTGPYLYPTTSPYNYPPTTTPYYFSISTPKETSGLTVSEETVMKHLLEKWLEENPNCKVSGQPNGNTCILKPAEACTVCITRWYLRK
jgi:hypothetical protein